MKRHTPPPTASLGFGIIPKEKDSKRRPNDNSARRAGKAGILIVDHDPALRRLMVTRLGAAGYTVDTADGALAALDACVRSRPNLVITDLRMKDMDGVAFLKELKSRWPQLSVIVLTGHGTISEAVQATQCGAFGYLVKPVGREELLGQVERATADLNFTAGEDWRSKLLVRSQLMEDRLRIANRAAASGVPILLTGENGTGKELFSRAIHAASVRREQPFVVVSCRDPDGDRLHRELFGGEPAASGESGTPRPGAIERARGGTLLLEEIGNLPIRLQVALAKSLDKDNGPAVRAGTPRSDVRLICTTSYDLKASAASGTFFRDLYYQINILPIEIPPLGRRREDIPLLVSHFLEQATEPGGRKKIYSPKAIELLATTDWPAKVRQLFDLVKRNIALAHSEIPTYDEARDKFSREYLAQNLRRTAGNVAQAARLAKRSRTDFYNLLARYRLHPEDFKNAAPEAHQEPDPDQDE